MAELSDKDRKKLPDSDFAEPQQRKYPMEDEAHARNALSRVSANGDEQEQEQRQVRDAVEERYPDIAE